MRPVNLFLTKDGVLKLGAYGLMTQAECYSIKGMNCDGLRSFAPEVFRGKYEMKSDVWSLGIVLLEMIGLTPFVGYSNSQLLTKGLLELPFDENRIKSLELIDFLKSCFEKGVRDRWSVNALMIVSDERENDE